MKDYNDFLESDFWKDLTKRKKELVNHCERCGAVHELQSHHKRYPKNWFDTGLDDLEVLCRGCHEKEHGLEMRTGNEPDWADPRSTNFSLLFSNVLHSTLWMESDDVRLVYITMLMMKDQYHCVYRDAWRIGRACWPNDLEHAEERALAAIKVLSEPDRFRHDLPEEGRKIRVADKYSWLILSGERDQECMRALFRQAKVDRRERERKRKKEKKSERNAVAAAEGKTLCEVFAEEEANQEGGEV